MKLSTKCRYGARAIIEIARNFGNSQQTKRKDITANQKIPSSYLENILIDLRNAGLVKTVRGPKGGFSLTRPPEEITMLDVLTALRGKDLLQVDCVEDQNCCERTDFCLTRQVWEAMKKAQDDALRSIHLKTLVLSGPLHFEKLDYII